MYELKIITHFAAAHQLRNFRGDCERLHGHSWKIEVCITSDTLDEAGIVVDFRVLKEDVKSIIKGMDHTFLNDLEPFRVHNPSSEYIARYIAEQLSLLLQVPGVKVSRVTAWESDNSCATYYP